MAMVKPIASKITAFDANSTSPQVFSFTVNGGNQVVKNRLTIRNQEDNFIVYQNTVTSYSFEQSVIPSKLKLENGHYYNFYFNTYDVNGEESEDSNVIQFYCYSEPTLVFNNFPQNGIVNNNKYNFIVEYYQEQSQLVDGLKFYLYDEFGNTIGESEMYGNENMDKTMPLRFEHTFNGFNNNENYQVEAIVQTVSGMKKSTGKHLFNVRYYFPEMFSLLDLENDCIKGCVKVKSNVIVADGIPSPSYEPEKYYPWFHVSEEKESEYIKWNKLYTIDKESIEIPSGRMLSRSMARSIHINPTIQWVQNGKSVLKSQGKIKLNGGIDYVFSVPSEYKIGLRYNNGNTFYGYYDTLTLESEYISTNEIDEVEVFLRYATLNVPISPEDVPSDIVSIDGDYSIIYDDGTEDVGKDVVDNISLGMEWEYSSDIKYILKQRMVIYKDKTYKFIVKDGYQIAVYIESENKHSFYNYNQEIELTPDHPYAQDGLGEIRIKHTDNSPLTEEELYQSGLIIIEGDIILQENNNDEDNDEDNEEITPTPPIEDEMEIQDIDQKWVSEWTETLLDIHELDNWVKWESGFSINQDFTFTLFLKPSNIGTFAVVGTEENGLVFDLVREIPYGETVAKDFVEVKGYVGGELKVLQRSEPMTLLNNLSYYMLWFRKDGNHYEVKTTVFESGNNKVNWEYNYDPQNLFEEVDDWEVVTETYEVPDPYKKAQYKGRIDISISKEVELGGEDEGDYAIINVGQRYINFDTNGADVEENGIFVSYEDLTKIHNIVSQNLETEFDVDITFNDIGTTKSDVEPKPEIYRRVAHTYNVSKLLHFSRNPKVHNSERFEIPILDFDGIYRNYYFNMDIWITDAIVPTKTETDSYAHLPQKRELLKDANYRWSVIENDAYDVKLVGYDENGNQQFTLLNEKIQDFNSNNCTQYDVILHKNKHKDIPKDWFYIEYYDSGGIKTKRLMSQVNNEEELKRRLNILKSMKIGEFEYLRYVPEEDDLIIEVFPKPPFYSEINKVIKLSNDKFSTDIKNAYIEYTYTKANSYDELKYQGKYVIKNQEGNVEYWCDKENYEKLLTLDNSANVYIVFEGYHDALATVMAYDAPPLDDNSRVTLQYTTPWTPPIRAITEVKISDFKKEKSKVFFNLAYVNEAEDEFSEKNYPNTTIELGKNLLDPNGWRYNYDFVMNKCALKANQTYSLKLYNKTDKYFLAPSLVYPNIVNHLCPRDLDSKNIPTTEYTFTPTLDITLEVYLYRTDTDNPNPLIEEVKDLQIQLEQGNTFTDFEPYYEIEHKNSNIEFEFFTDISWQDEEYPIGEEFVPMNEDIERIFPIGNVYISRGLYDHMDITQDTTFDFSTEKRDWDYQTRINCDFEDNIMGGNLLIPFKELEAIRIKRRKSNTFDWITLKEIVIKDYDDLTIMLEDYYLPSDYDADYAIVPILSNGVEGNYIIRSITTNYKVTIIADSENVFKLSNVTYGGSIQNTVIGTYQPLKGLYPIMQKNSELKYYSGSITCNMLGYNHIEGKPLDRKDIAKQTDDYCNFLNNDRAKILKDWNGNIYLVRFMGSPSIAYNGNYGNGYVQVAANWVEQGKYDNQKDLYNGGLVNSLQ